MTALDPKQTFATHKEMGLERVSYRVIVLLILFSGTAYSAENISQAEYVGNWVQARAITEGETSTLTISEEFVVKLTRSFSNGRDDYELASGEDGIQFHGDIAIVELFWGNGDLACKLVLSGWRANELRQIFGTMFMYRDGDLFNGLPVSFYIRH